MQIEDHAKQKFKQGDKSTAHNGFEWEWDLFLIECQKKKKGKSRDQPHAPMRGGMTELVFVQLFDAKIAEKAKEKAERNKGGKAKRLAKAVFHENSLVGDIDSLPKMRKVIAFSRKAW